MSTDPTLVVDYEREVLTAIFARDKVRMTELMSADGFGFDATMGLVGQRELIAGIDGLSDDAAFSMEHIEVECFDPALPVVAYLLRQWGSFGGRPLPPAVYCSSAWSITDGRWQAMFHHETPVPG